MDIEEELKNKIYQYKLKLAHDIARRYPGVTVSTDGHTVGIHNNGVNIPKEELDNFSKQITPDDLP